jgi:hypothetical protein
VDGVFLSSKLVTAHATKEGRHHEHPVRAEHGRPDPGLSAIMRERVS